MGLHWLKNKFIKRREFLCEKTNRTSRLWIHFD